MGFRMPAEWDAHERTLMAWPTHPSWGSHLENARITYAAWANAIAAFEPLTMFVNPGGVDGARQLLTGGIEIVEIKYDSAWVRDFGPLVVVDDEGHRAGVDFHFNSWGEKFLPGRAVMGVPAKLISYAGGGPHCTTMQIPIEGGVR